MFELLPRSETEVFIDADIAEAGIAFQVLDPLRRQQQKLFDFGIVGLPQLAIVLRVLDQHLVRAEGGHAVIETLAAPVRWDFNVINRPGMHHRPRRPGTAADRGAA